MNLATIATAAAEAAAATAVVTTVDQSKRHNEKIPRYTTYMPCHCENASTTSTMIIVGVFLVDYIQLLLFFAVVFFHLLCLFFRLFY